MIKNVDNNDSFGDFIFGNKNLENFKEKIEKNAIKPDVLIINTELIDKDEGLFVKLTEGKSLSEREFKKKLDDKEAVRVRSTKNGLELDTSKEVKAKIDSLKKLKNFRGFIIPNQSGNTEKEQIILASQIKVIGVSDEEYMKIRQLAIQKFKELSKTNKEHASRLEEFKKRTIKYPISAKKIEDSGSTKKSNKAKRMNSKLKQQHQEEKEIELDRDLKHKKKEKERLIKEEHLEIERKEERKEENKKIAEEKGVEQDLGLPPNLEK